MPTISPSVLPVLMLFVSNVFMTFAWYGHLKFKESWLPFAIMVSWGIAFFEYWLAVPANRLRGVFSGAAQDHAGGDHAGRVRRLLRFVFEGAAGVESRTGFCADRRRCVFHFSQMVVTERTSLRAQRSNPELQPRLDCFVAEPVIGRAFAAP